MDASEIEDWADRRTAKLTSLFRLEDDPPVSLREIGCILRASYAKGYMDALASPCPPTIEDTMNREAALRAMLPT